MGAIITPGSCFSFQRFFDRLLSSRSSLPPQGEKERSIRSATQARWVTTMDVALVAGPPEILGGGGTNFKWIPVNLRGLVRSIPTPKGRP